MNNQEILEHTSHRPFPLPKGPWMMKQGWNKVLFAHWPVSEASVSPFIPPGLELQQWEGRPWISVVPFQMDPLLVRGLPPLPFVHTFLELNIRTYVIKDGKPGVFFLNMDASSLPAVTGARVLTYLPYNYADMTLQSEGHGVRYISKRQTKLGEAVFNGVYSAAQSVPVHAIPGTLLHWLTERYCLFAVSSKGNLYVGDIHHQPWPLQEAKLQLDQHTSTKALGLAHESEPSFLTYTERLEVLLWPLKKI
ncbi:YqjF family protein [Paenibacillus sp. GCM10012306]|uniref:YqjF family protein n=1 Tax=Paenibacillus sp. GCM10012306 TaxID=3317342 RepID=UPI00361805B3